MLRVSERCCDGDPAICTLHCICKLIDFFLEGELLLPKQITRLTGGNCQKKTLFETLLFSSGGREASCSVTNCSRRQSWFPPLLSHCSHTPQSGYWMDLSCLLSRWRKAEIATGCGVHCDVMRSLYVHVELHLQEQ